MDRLAWWFPLGVFSAPLLPALPPLLWLLVSSGLLLVLAIALLCHKFSYCWLLPPVIILLGFCYGCLWGHWQLAHRLPVDLDKSDYVVTGTISELPDSNEQRTRFTFSVDNISALQSTSQSRLPPVKKLLLSWYHQGDSGVRPKAGEHWQLQVRLRSLRGFHNPGGFDYHRWLFGQRYSATGYVRKSPENRQLVSDKGSPLLRWRAGLADAMAARDSTFHINGILQALVVGNKQAVEDDVWQTLRRTGTVHLLVVSGLHIGMVALLCYSVGGLFGRVFVALGLVTRHQSISAVLVLLGAGFYALLSGLGLPVIRALIMTAVVIAAILLKRHSSPWQALAWALCLISVVDPLAVLQAGFWLSFMAVFGLMLWFVPRQPRAGLRQLMEAQGVVFLVLCAALLAFQGTLSLSAPLINLLVIPWMSFTIIPLCLLGAVFCWLPALQALLWDLAAWQLDALVRLLEWAASLTRWNSWQPGAMDSAWLVAGYGLVGVGLLLPRAIGLGGPLLLLLGLLLASKPALPALELTVLDVGQGLAAVVRSEDHTLVYDTGPYFSPAFNAGSGIIAPYLGHLGVRQIDKLVVSHGDRDHAGGVAGLRDSMAIDQLVSSEPVLPMTALQTRPCLAGQQWRWNDVTFHILWPPAQGQELLTDNNRSCVLFIEYGKLRILLPGDIESAVEDQLLAHPLLKEGVDILVAPHHGSKSSSGRHFVTAMHPEHVVFSAGFNHHFGHPHPQVVERYRHTGSQMWNTAYSGAITFGLNKDHHLVISEAAKHRSGYWY